MAQTHFFNELQDVAIALKPVVIEFLQVPVPAFVAEAGRKPAGAFPAFKKLYPVAGKREVARRAQASDAGADDADLQGSRHGWFGPGRQVMPGGRVCAKVVHCGQARCHRQGYS